MQRDSLGDRMKEYENAYRLHLTRRVPVIVRIDGKAFHTFTKGLKRPFDEAIYGSMIDTAIELCRNVEGCKLAYTQSDEISLVLRNDDELTTQAWFGNNLQKIVSVTASMATRAFNLSYRTYVEKNYRLPASFDFIGTKLQEIFSKRHLLYSKKIDGAMFDSRAFIIPEEEVVNYFIWRQQDAIRNSIEACARALYSDKELYKKNCSEMIRMMTDKGFDWNSLPTFLRSGTCIVKSPKVNGATRTKWITDCDIPLFMSNRDYILDEVWKEERRQNATQVNE